MNNKCFIWDKVKKKHDRRTSKHQTYSVSDSFSFLTRQPRYQSLLMYLWLPNTLIHKHMKRSRLTYQPKLVNKKKQSCFQRERKWESTYSGASESHLHEPPVAAGLKIERPGQFALFHALNGFVMRAVRWEDPSRRRAQITRGQARATAVCGSVRLWKGEGVFSQESVSHSICVRIGKHSPLHYPHKSCIICASKVITP